MKILITNTVALNGGDAAILTGVIKLLTAAFGEQTQFTIFDRHADIASHYYSDLKFLPSIGFRQETSNIANPFIKKIKELGRKIGVRCLYHKQDALAKIFLSHAEFESLQEYCSADLIVSTGGTYLLEIYNLEARIYDFNMALYFNKPLIFFTQSLGPFTTPQYRHALKRIFEKAALILLRDSKSLNNIVDLGVKDARTHITADAAFALADPIAIEASAKREATGDAGLTIAISVREWKHFQKVEPTVGQKRYVKALRALTIHLVEKHQANITFISTCQGIPEYWNDDSEVAQNIVKALPDEIKDSVTVDTTFHPPEEFARIVGAFDMMIATRLHAAILALGVGTPVLPIAYEFKTQELFAELGQSHWVQDIENIEVTSLIDTTNEFIQSLPQTRHEQCVATKKERERALTSMDLVKDAYAQWKMTAKTVSGSLNLASIHKSTIQIKK